MKRREFIGSCAGWGGLASLGVAGWGDALADAPVKSYQRTRLVDVHGKPIRLVHLAADTNYVFHYPFAATPCLLLKLSKPVLREATLKREDGTPYAWRGGVGEQRNVVAFSAICAHRLAYPTREVSFIRFQPARSATSSAQVIHCCADHSVYDPAEGARVLSGPAPQPLAAIVLEHDAAQDQLFATGTLGPEQFPAFFNKYQAKLALEYGERRMRAATGDTAVVRELGNYCRTTIEC